MQTPGADTSIACGEAPTGPRRAVRAAGSGALQAGRSPPGFRLVAVFAEVAPGHLVQIGNPNRQLRQRTEFCRGSRYRSGTDSDGILAAVASGLGEPLGISAVSYTH